MLIFQKTVFPCFAPLFPCIYDESERFSVKFDLRVYRIRNIDHRYLKKDHSEEVFVEELDKQKHDAELKQTVGDGFFGKLFANILPGIKDKGKESDEKENKEQARKKRRKEREKKKKEKLDREEREKLIQLLTRQIDEKEARSRSADSRQAV